GHLARRFFLPGRPDIRLVRGTARTPRRRPLRAVSYIHSLRADIVPPTSRTRLASHRGMGQTPATENTTPGFGSSRLEAPACIAAGSLRHGAFVALGHHPGVAT